jgi:hypothetical protein
MAAPRAKPPIDITPTAADLADWTPPDGRSSGAQCRACKLKTIDPDAYLAMTDMLLTGHSLQSVVDYLATRGHRFTRQKLSTHRTRHMSPAQAQLAERKLAMRSVMELAQSTPAEDLIATTVQLPSAAIIEGLKVIEPANMVKAAKRDAMEFVEFADRHAKVMAGILSTIQRTKILQIKLRLDAARADQEADALLTRALSALRKELSKSPAGLEMLEALQDFVAAPAP